MRDKPARFGLKEFTLADSENGYVLDINVYAGKGCGEDSKGSKSCCWNHFMD